MAIRIIEPKQSTTQEGQSEIVDRSGPLDKEAVSKVVEWYMDELNAYDAQDKITLFLALVQGKKSKALLSMISLRSEYAVRKEMLKWLASLCVEADCYPNFDYDFESCQELAASYTPREKVNYYRYLLKEIPPYGLETNRKRSEFRLRCEREIEYIESTHSTVPRDLSSDSMPSEAIEPIEWCKGPGTIMYLFRLLERAGYISKETFAARAELISTHFVDKNGSPWKKQFVQTSESNYKKNATKTPANASRLERIVEHLDEFSMENP